MLTRSWFLCLLSAVVKLCHDLSRRSALAGSSSVTARRHFCVYSCSLSSFTLYVSVYPQHDTMIHVKSINVSRTLYGPSVILSYFMYRWWFHVVVHLTCILSSRRRLCWFQSVGKIMKTWFGISYSRGSFGQGHLVIDKLLPWQHVLPAPAFHQNMVTTGSKKQRWTLVHKLMSDVRWVYTCLA